MTERKCEHEFVSSRAWELKTVQPGLQLPDIMDELGQRKSPLRNTRKAKFKGKRHWRVTKAAGT